DRDDRRLAKRRADVRTLRAQHCHGQCLGQGEIAGESDDRFVQRRGVCEGDRALRLGVHRLGGSMEPFIGRTEVLADPPALAERVAEWMTATAAASKGAFRVALSGGSTPKALYGLLASDRFRDRFPWQRTFWFWGDERFVPYDHPDSNYRMAREAMLAKAPVPPENIHPIPTDGDPEDAARRYERTLREAYGSSILDPARPFFDVTLLGLGDDGHTASLLPAHDLLDERKRWVAAVLHGRPEIRITMTYP